MTTVRLGDIIDGLEMQTDDSLAFLDLDTGEVEVVSIELLGMAEESDGDEEPDLPAWQREEWKAAKRIASSDRLRKLPTKFDIHEWAIMRDFAESVESAAIRDDLLFAIHGAGAFRHFKHNLRRHGIEESWFQFRDQALRQIAIDWCEEQGIRWEEGRRFHGRG
jgi:hypothetical protein